MWEADDLKVTPMPSQSALGPMIFTTYRPVHKSHTRSLDRDRSGSLHFTYRQLLSICDDEELGTRLERGLSAISEPRQAATRLASSLDPPSLK